MSKWKKVTFKNAPLEIIDGDRGTNYPKQSDFLTSGYCLFLNAGNVTREGFSFSNCTFISQEKDSILRKGKLKKYDTILTTRGTVGNVAFFDDSVQFKNIRINSGMVILRPKPENLDPRYLYLFVRSADFQEQLLAMLSGSAQPQLPIRDINQIVISLPPLPEQKAIAHILGSLDDKIELNRRMNETLEAMARAIFKDWFVDFGPTRAKIEDRAPYLPEPIWSLFPDAIDPQSGLPQGWESSKLEDFMELAYGKSLTAKNRLPGDVVVYGSGGEIGFHNEALISSPAVIVGRKGTVGSIYWEDRPIFPIDTVFYVVPKKTSLFFCYQLLLTQPLANMNTDAAVPGLNRNNAYRLEFPYPGSDLLNAYELITSPIWAQRSVNIKESRTLAELRDRLLPKLMSGQIRVKDAEKLVEEVL